SRSHLHETRAMIELLRIWSSVRCVSNGGVTNGVFMLLSHDQDWCPDALLPRIKVRQRKRNPMDGPVVEKNESETPSEYLHRWMQAQIARVRTVAAGNSSTQSLSFENDEYSFSHGQLKHIGHIGRVLELWKQGRTRRFAAVRFG